MFHDDLSQIQSNPNSLAVCRSLAARWTELDEAALIQILTEPKNTDKQYGKLFEMEGVDLGSCTGTEICGGHWSAEPVHVACVCLLSSGVLLDTMYEILAVRGK